MDFLNKAWAQIVELFRSLTPGARLVAGLLAAAIVVSLTFLFRAQTSSADDYLLGGREFSRPEIALAEAAFAKAKLAKSEIVGNKIRIPRDQKAAYLAAMADSNALPDDFGTRLTHAAAGDNPFMSGKVLDLRVQVAKQREMALIVSQMQGIEVATVTFDEVDKPGFPRRKEKSAMVAVKPKAGAELTPEQIRAIRNTVAGAYAGLDRQSVTVTDMSIGRSYAGNNHENDGTGDDNMYAEAKQQYEQNWQQKIYERLRMIPGVVVAVNVDLVPELRRQGTNYKIDPKPVTVESKEQSESINTSAPSTQGRPGAVPNSLVNAPASVSQESGPKSSTEKKNDSTRAEVSREQITTVHAPLTPKQVQAIVDVPMSYYRKIWSERNPTVAGEQPKVPQPADLDKIEAETKKRIEESVVKLLPRPEVGNDPFIPVMVTSYQDLAQPALAGPTLMETSSSWLAANWQTIAMVLVGVASLWMLRGMLRSSAPAPTPATPSLAADAELAAHDLNSEPANDAPAVKAPRRRFGTSGPSLRDELREMVKEDPDAAATVLRAWIGDAA